MSSKYPSFVTPLLGLTILLAPCLWYFDWATWSWITAGVLYVLICCGWLSEALKIYRAGQTSPGAAFSGGRNHYLDDFEEDEFLNEGKVVWKGRRQVCFSYCDHHGSSSNREVIVHQVVAIGRTKADFYFRGHCLLRNEPRTFRVDRVQGRMIADVVTGEVTTFHQFFALRQR